MTTCPSGVHYMHLVDQARRRIEETFRRPLADRLMRAALALVLPRPLAVPRRARRGTRGAAAAAPAAGAAGRDRRARARARAPAAARSIGRRSFAAEGARRKRVALLTGCVQSVLAPAINEATIRLLTRHGCEVVISPRRRLLRRPRPSHGPRRARFRARQHRRLDADARCGRARRGHHQRLGLRRHGQGLRPHAARGSAPTPQRRRASRRWPRMCASSWPKSASPRRCARPGSASPITPPARCSMASASAKSRRRLLAAAGFIVLDVPEGHLCCGSAGTYNLLQPELAGALRQRKVAHIESTAPRSRRQRQYRLHDADRGGNAGYPSCTRSSCSTGRPAARRRRSA